MSDQKRKGQLLPMKESYLHAEVQMANRSCGEKIETSFDGIVELSLLIELYRCEFPDGIRTPNWRDAFIKTVAITLVNAFPETTNAAVPQKAEQCCGEETEASIAEHTRPLMKLYCTEFHDGFHTPSWQQVFVETVKINLLVVAHEKVPL